PGDTCYGWILRLRHPRSGGGGLILKVEGTRRWMLLAGEREHRGLVARCTGRRTRCAVGPVELGRDPRCARSVNAGAAPRMGPRNAPVSPRPRAGCRDQEAR